MNPITDLTGPQFLVFYAVLITVTVAYCWFRRRGSDALASLPPPALPQRFDPYEIAYLRGGDREVARVAVVRLAQSGYLLTGGKRIVTQTDHPPLQDLTDLERCVFDWVAQERNVKDVFYDSELIAMLRSHTLRYEERLHRDRMLVENDAMAGYTAIALALIAGVGILRLFVGLVRQRPVGFLILMGIAGLIALFLVSRRSRLSARGEAYLKGLQQEWEQRARPVQVDDDSIVLATGLFGAGVLAGTPYEDLSHTNKSHDSSASISCSAGGDGGGGGCSGGGGCGGGCGGCGGG